jgi:hypothetical protein
LGIVTHSGGAARITARHSTSEPIGHALSASGIFSRGNLTIGHSFIATNRATFGGGGLFIDTIGGATLTSVGFEGNTAPGGNGIWSLGTTTLKDVDVQSH